MTCDKNTNRAGREESQSTDSRSRSGECGAKTAPNRSFGAVSEILPLKSLFAGVGLFAGAFHDLGHSGWHDGGRLLHESDMSMELLDTGFRRR